MKDAMEKYNEITYKIPPVLTAAAVPVVALSLLCKTVTGHGLPGTLLGSVEGLSWLVLPLGAGSLAPKLGRWSSTHPTLPLKPPPPPPPPPAAAAAFTRLLQTSHHHINV